MAIRQARAGGVPASQLLEILRRAESVVASMN
jgi:hypothetical protein